MSNKRPRKRSRVWDHFEETPDRKRAICKHCGSSLSAKSTGGTTHLNRHIETCSKQRDPDSENKVTNFGLTEDKSWEVQVKMAVLAEIPFAPSDCKKVFYSLNCPTGIDIEKLISSYYDREKEKLHAEFQNLTSRVSFTLNLLKEAGYISITAHFITGDFNLVNKLIGFKKITDISSQTCIASAIESCISDWSFGEKAYMFTYDGDNFYLPVVQDVASNVDFRSIQPFCTQAITSSCTDILLNLFHLEPVKIVKFIKHVGPTKSKMDELNQICKEQGLPPINVSLFMEFNLCTAGYKSIIGIIKYAFRYKEVFRQYARRDADLMVLSQVNWGKVEVILNLCWLLKDMINGFSSFKNPTLSLYVQYLLAKISHNDLSNSTCIKAKGGITYEIDLKLSILYFICKSISILSIACVLDPRYKQGPFGYMEEKCQLKFMKGIRGIIHGELQALFDKYAEEKTNQTSLHTATTTHPVHVQNINTFTRYLTQKPKVKSTTSELDEYLSEEVVVITDGSFDLLGWWKENRSRYPVLSRMARDILAVPVSVYKVNEDITSDLRHLEVVDPLLVEAVICFKNWIISSSQS